MDNEDPKRRKIKNLKDVGMCVIDIMQYQQERKHISKSLRENMISIDTGDIKATDFDLTVAQKRQLALAGRKGVEGFLVKKEAKTKLPSWRLAIEGKK